MQDEFDGETADHKRAAEKRKAAEEAARVPVEPDAVGDAEAEPKAAAPKQRKQTTRA